MIPGKECYRTPLCAKNRSQAGVGLIEVLIAVVLLSIGFLAAAQMQVQGLRFSQSAYFQSQAYFMASDIIDRMRNNAKGLSDGEYTDGETLSTLVNPNCGSSSCNEAQIAAQDLYDWSARLYPLNQAIDTAGAPIGHFVAALPSSDSIAAKGLITSLGSGVFRVSVSWSEIIDGEPVEQSVQVNFAAEAS